MKNTNVSYRNRRPGLFASGFLVLCILSLVIVPACADDQPTVTIDSYTLTPQVLAPGDSGTLSVVIKNTAGSATLTESSGTYLGGAFATTKTVDIPATIDTILLQGNGIEVVSGNYQRFGALGPGQSVTVTFAIRAPQKEGIYFPEVWVDINGGKNVRYPIPVNVNSLDQLIRTPTIVVEKQLSGDVNPGESFTVLLNAKNAGALRAGQVTMTINTSTTSIGVEGPNTILLGDIEGGASYQVPLSFVTDKNVPLGLQKINLNLAYQLPDGSQKQQTEVVQVPIKGKAEMNIASITTEPANPAAGDQVTLIIRLENTGTDTAKSVSAAVDLPMDGTKEAFIGKIKPNNDAPAIFTVKTGAAGDYAYTLTTKYTDEWGNHTLTRTLHLIIAQSDYTAVIILIVIVAAGAAFYFLYWRRRGAA